jgi:hypothetical protein
LGPTLGTVRKRLEQFAILPRFPASSKSHRGSWGRAMALSWLTSSSRGASRSLGLSAMRSDGVSRIPVLGCDPGRLTSRRRTQDEGIFALTNLLIRSKVVPYMGMWSDNDNAVDCLTSLMPR